MIEPYSRYITQGDKIKRYHKLIFEMWLDYKSNIEIAKTISSMGCKVDRRKIGLYIRRCLEEEGLPHDYSMPHPKNFISVCAPYHDRIAYLRNYLGYTGREIAKEIGVGQSSVYRYTDKCYEEEY